MNATIKNSSFNENDALLKISILPHTIKIKMNQLHLMNSFFQQPSKGVPKICSKFTGEHPCRSVISTKLQSKFIEITLFLHGCSSVNLLHIFRTPFLKNTSRLLLLFSSNSNFCKLLITFVKKESPQIPDTNAV